MSKELTKTEELEAQVHYCEGMAEQYIAQAKKDARRIKELKAKLKKLHTAAMALGSHTENDVDCDLFDKVNSALYSMMETTIDDNGNLANPILCCVVCGGADVFGGHHNGCPVGVLEEYVRDETSEDF